MRRLLLAVGAGAAIAGATVLHHLAGAWPRAGRWERIVGEAGKRISLDRSPFGRGLDVVLQVAVPLGAVLLAPVVLGLYHRGSRRLAVACVTLFAGSFATTELLKLWLAPRPNVPARFATGYPSGHTTVAFATGIVVVLAAPWRSRLTPVAAAAGYTTFVAAALVVDGWHLPSDVVGALCVTAAWTLATLAVLAPPVRLSLTRGDTAGAIVLSGLAIVLLLTHVGVPTHAPLLREVAEAIVLVGGAGAAAVLAVSWAIAALGARSNR